MIEVKVPDIGDFTDVPVIEILVAPGDTVAPEDPLITLESDKATMDVPSPAAGVVGELKVEVGDKVSMGSLILMLEEAAAEGDPADDGKAPAETAAAPPAESAEPDADVQADVVVLGAGPGGYTAAFRAADLGLKTVLVERHERLGGVCLNVGCIPSKALLHIARVMADVEESAAHGITFGEPEIDVDKLRGWKDSVVEKLTGGLTGLAKQRKVEVVRGTGTFTSPNLLSVEGEDGTTSIGFKHCIIAAGSSPTVLPGMPEDDPRLMDSTGALELADIPERLLVIGGGIIGLEMATVYDALGSKVTVVELLDALIPGCDQDLVKPLQKRIEKRYEAIRTGDEGRGRRGARRRAARQLRGRRRARAGDLRPHPARRRPAPQRRLARRGRGGRHRRRRRLHPRRPPDAHERARTSSPSATSSASRCSRTRRRTRARSPPR